MNPESQTVHVDAKQDPERIKEDQHEALRPIFSHHPLPIFGGPYYNSKRGKTIYSLQLLVGELFMQESISLEDLEHANEAQLEQLRLKIRARIVSHDRPVRQEDLIMYNLVCTFETALQVQENLKTFVNFQQPNLVPITKS